MSSRVSVVPSIRGLGLPRLILVLDPAVIIFQSVRTATTFSATQVIITGTPVLSMIQPNMLVSCQQLDGNGLLNPTYAKVLSVSLPGGATGYINIDFWTNGTPTSTAGTADGDTLVNGWVADLPRTEEMTETFTPDNLQHSLYAGDQGSILSVKNRGWKYLCTLDYHTFVTADTLLLLRKHFGQHPNDRLVLIPRIDAPQIQINVIFDQPIPLVRFGRALGYKKFMLSFKGKENLASWQMIDGYGVNYAQDYGINY